MLLVLTVTTEQQWDPPTATIVNVRPANNNTKELGSANNTRACPSHWPDTLSASVLFARVDRQIDSTQLIVLKQKSASPLRIPIATPSPAGWTRAAAPNSTATARRSSHPLAAPAARSRALAPTSGDALRLPRERGVEEQ